MIRAFGEQVKSRGIVLLGNVSDLQRASFCIYVTAAQSGYLGRYLLAVRLHEASSLIERLVCGSVVSAPVKRIYRVRFDSRGTHQRIRYLGSLAIKADNHARISDEGTQRLFPRLSPSR